MYPDVLLGMFPVAQLILIYGCLQSTDGLIRS